MTEDKYIKEYLDGLNKCKSNEDKLILLNRLYDDGVYDGNSSRDEEFANNPTLFLDFAKDNLSPIEITELINELNDYLKDKR
jgi:hypothetical protein